MIKYFKKNALLFVVSSFVALLGSSCGSTKQKIYFEDLDSSKVSQLNIPDFKEPLIQTDDILSISVQTIDVAASAALNQLPVLSGMQGGNGAVGGFLVDKAGNVEMPILGILKLAGLTSSAAKEVVRARAAQFYKEPTVQVRFANFKITILGEVSKPSSYNLPNEKVTILDAISMAGDLTVYGKRENVLLMRQNGEKREIVRLNLASSEVLSSPYFYLKQNDVLIVEATPAKFAINNAPRNQLISLGLSLAAFGLTLFRIF